MSKAAQELHKMRRMSKVWTPWREVTITDEIRNTGPQMEHVDKIYANSKFEVQTFNCATSIGGVVQVVIAHHGHLLPVTWNDVLRIKNEIFGADQLGVEIYPREVVSKMNIRILWILPVGTDLPYGLDKDSAWGGLQ